MSWGPFGDQMPPGVLLREVKMPRKGRGLEELVRDLESFLADSPVDVRSPDFLVDKDTGEQREVDVSVRAKVGSVVVLVILECRDRLKRQGVDWIEQLADKRDSVGAHRAVAVSSSAFTRGAVKKAAAREVELRTFAEIDKSVALEWVDSLLANSRNFELSWDNIHFELIDRFDCLNGATLPVEQEDRRVDAPLLLAPNGEGRSLSDAFISKAADELVKLFPSESDEWGARVEMHFTSEPDRYDIEMPEGRFAVAKMSANFKLRRTEADFSVERRLEYSSKEGPLGHSVRARGRINGIPVVYDFHEGGEGEPQAVLQITRPDPSDDRILRIIFPSGGERELPTVAGQ